MPEDGQQFANQRQGIGCLAKNWVARVKHSWVPGFLADFPWIHLGIGIFGNITFVVGSVLFLYQDLQTIGIWLFIIGSSGMLLGSFGELLARLDRHFRTYSDPPDANDS
jgi:hypothetical protein